MTRRHDGEIGDMMLYRSPRSPFVRKVMVAARDHAVAGLR